MAPGAGRGTIVTTQQDTREERSTWPSSEPSHIPSSWRVAGSIRPTSSRWPTPRTATTRLDRPTTRPRRSTRRRSRPPSTPSRWRGPCRPTSGAGSSGTSPPASRGGERSLVDSSRSRPASRSV